MPRGHKFTVKSADEESYEVFLDGKSIVSADHDTDGWEGMRRIRQTIDAIANALDIPVVTR